MNEKRKKKQSVGVRGAGVLGKGWRKWQSFFFSPSCNEHHPPSGQVFPLVTSQCDLMCRDTSTFFDTMHLH